MIDARKRLASRLQTLRVVRYLTQEGLAKRSGVGRATIARIETGRTTPQMRTVMALARALDVDPTELVADPTALWTS